MSKTTRPLVMAFGVMALLIAAALILMPADTADVPAETTGRARDITPQEGCEIEQTMIYTRCGHTVVRRSAAPAEVYGQPLDAVQGLYTDWRLTEFGAKLIKMQKNLQLYCPDHMVLMPDGAGMLCVFENRYGDALALVNELNIPVNTLPAAAQEDVEMGLGFDSADALEMWLESVES